MPSRRHYLLALRCKLHEPCIASALDSCLTRICAYFNSTEKVLTVVPIALMPQIMLAGVVEKITSVKVDVLSYLTLGRWGTEGITRLQKGDAMSAGLKELYYGKDLSDKGSFIVDLFNDLGANILIILILSAIMYVLTYYSLKKKDTI